MRELSLFSGAGGGLLGALLLGWRPVGYVEWDDYCQRVLRARIDDGYLPAAPIFGDIRAFVRDGYAASYTGLVDVVTGGFPCQPFSTAGKRAGADDPRNMWPATIDVIRVVRPKWCLLENVPGLLSSGYFGTVIGDLAESGYDVRWRVLSAAEVGAPHKRDRLWIVADAKKQRMERSARQNGQSDRNRQEWLDTFGSSANMADSPRIQPGREEQRTERKRAWPGSEQSEGRAGELANTQSERLERRSNGGEGINTESEQLLFAGPGKRGTGQWWATEPTVGGMAHGLAAGMDGFAADGAGNLARVARGVPDRVSRLKALGNGQVPAVAAAAWRLLTEDL